MIEIKEQLEKLSNADMRNNHDIKNEILNTGNEVAEVSQEAIKDLYFM